jgi:hypothetical protein
LLCKGIDGQYILACTLLPRMLLNNLNAAEQISIEVGNYATVELPDKVSVPDLRSQFIHGWDDGLGVFAAPIGAFTSFGTTGSNYTAIPLLACIKYQ